MIALVIGAAGFIGSHLATRLVKDGHKVIAVDDMTAGKPENWNDIDCIKIIEDVTSKFGMNTIFSIHKPEVIFHNAASKKNICLEDPHRDLQVNGGGTLNLLELSMEYGIKKFIHASTGSVYGEVEGVITEKTPYNPVSYYGISKMAGESYVKMFPELEPVILRYFHVYGPGQDHSQLGGVVSIFINNILSGKKHTIFGDGKQVRSFTYVQDVVEANMRALKLTGTYNVASGLKVSLIELCERLEKITGLHYGYNFKDWQVGDIKNFDVRSNLDIKYTSLDVGLNETLWHEKLKYTS